MLWRITLKKLNRAYSAGQWTTRLFTDSEALLQNHPNIDTLRFHLLLCHSLHGLSTAQLHRIVPTVPPALLTSPTIALMMLSLLGTASDQHSQTVADCIAQAKSAIPHDNARLLARYPVVLRHLPENTTTRRPATDRLRHKATSLLDRTTTLENGLRQFSMDQSGHRIAIVGNSPIALHRGAGSEIDAHDTVIRFNHASVEAKFQTDYGSKTHIQVVSPAYRFSSSEALCHTIVVSGVQPFNRPGKFWQHLSDQANNQYMTFDPSVWYQLVSQLNAPPSAGLLCVSQLMALRDSGVTVNLYGFGQDLNTENNHYSDRHKKSGRHNWPVEQQLLASLAGN